MERRYIITIAFIFSIFIILTLRLFNLTIIHHKKEDGDPSHYGSHISTLLRGTIYSKNKDVLAISLPFYSYYIDPSMIDRENLQEYNNLFDALSITPETANNILRSNKKFRWLNRMMDEASFKDINQLYFTHLPGVKYITEYKRVYPYNMMASSIIGFTDIDGKGIAGLEYSFNSMLTYMPKMSNANYDLNLTIDSRLQSKIELILSNTAKELKPDSISAIIMEVSSGKILTMASYPFFDNNQFNLYRDPSIFVNTNISSIDEPGSTFKPLILTYLFDKKLINENKRFFTEGKANINGSTIRDVGNKVLGMLSPKEILMKSSNIGMAKASQNISKDSLYLFLQNLDLGEKTNIRLPSEEAGIIRTPENMSERSKIAIPIGQEIGLTPLQLVKAFSAIANHGIMVSPVIIDSIEKQGKIIAKEYMDKIFPPSLVRVFTSKNADRILEYMRAVVTHGSASRVNIKNEWIAAKTGTAQVFDSKKGKYDKVNTSVIAIYKSRQDKYYIIYGVIRNPKIAIETAWGGTIGAVMVKSFIQSLIRYLATTS